MLGSHVWEEEEELVETAFEISSLGPCPVSSLSLLLVVQDVNSEPLLYLIHFVCLRAAIPTVPLCLEKALI